MPSNPSIDAAEPDGAEESALSALRAELDRIDDAIHDKLMERAEVVARVLAEGRKAHTPYRPGREAAILRRLLARHQGPLSREGIVRIWRELITAGTAMQGGNTVAVFDPDPACGYTQLAREQFGALVPMRVHRSPSQALSEIAVGQAGLAVLPMPSEIEPQAEAWWTMLLHDRRRARPEAESCMHVVARLPFWRPRPEGAPQAQALAVSRAAPDPSGEDHTLLGIEMASDVSRARLAGALSAANLKPLDILLRRDAATTAALALIEVDGFVTEADPRLDALGDSARRPLVLGAFAVPVGGGAP